MNIQGWEDFVNTNYQQEIKTGGSVNVPSDDKLNFAINNVFQTYYNRDATEVEAANLREQIKSAAFASPRIGDWIDIDNDEFSDIGETKFSVIHVTIYTDHRGINIGVSEKDYNIYLVDSFGKYFHNL